MNLFLDANILVSVLNKEYPLFPYTSRILSLAGKKPFQLFTSPVCLAIAFYFSQKKHKSALAKQKIHLLTQHISIAQNSENGVSQTLANPKILDFEDGIEYYAALENKCQCIITEDRNDFHFSEIEVLSSKEFFEKYLMQPIHK